MVLAFFTLFLLRIVLRKEWLAALATLALYGSVIVAPNVSGPLEMTVALGAFALVIIAMLRYDLIAAIFAYAIGGILDLPHTLDFSAWYAATSFVPLVLVAMLAIYGFRTSLGGRRLIEIPE